MDITLLDKQIKNNRVFREEIVKLIDFCESDIFDYKNGKDKKKYSINRQSLKEIKVAAIMDRFTLECFEPECDLLQLTPDDWKNEIKAFNPDMLFIESAWRGKDDLWTGKVNHCAKELQDLTDYCHDKNIPIVFWNKEDPIYTDTFMPTARRADYVFTTDIDCVQKYKTQCKHDRVYHLHFAAQPKTHNPIEKYERKDKLCFAGAYYTRYPERCEVFNNFSEVFIENKGLDIYDRNFNDPESEYKFPDKYKPYILGCLDPSEIDVAYKGYKYGVNMNSVNQSQTMFARRVFELLASNTVVVGNYSRGVKNYFGDLTICTNDKATLEKNVKDYCNDEVIDKYRLLGLRKVLSEHLMEDRFRYIVNKITNNAYIPKEKLVNVISIVKGNEEAISVINSFDRQKYEDKKLIICCGENMSVAEKRKDVVFISEPTVFSEIIKGDFVAYFSPSDWYGEKYLVDLLLATRYVDADIYCKKENYEFSSGKSILHFKGSSYSTVDDATFRTSVVKKSVFTSVVNKDISEDFSFANTEHKLFSIDRFNYCKNLPESETCEEAKELSIVDKGLSISEINNISEKIKPQVLDEKSKCVGADDICKLQLKEEKRIKITKVIGKARIESELPEGIHGYYYIPTNIAIGECIKDGRLNIIFNGETTMNIMGCVMILNEKKEKIDIKTISLNRKLVIDNIPQSAVYVRLGFRIREDGYALISDILIGDNYNSKLINGCFLSRSDIMVLTNHYPSAKDLYKNAFVKSRVQGYKNDGYLVDIMRMYPYSDVGYREYDGINIVEGHEDVLDDILTNSNVKTICVHFLDADMWKVLKKHITNIHLIIWSHGADIKPWWRREFNYTEETLYKGKEQSEQRMKMWKHVFRCAETNNIEFVFVSQSFADEVFEDYEIDRDKIKYSIIHNYIDTDKFHYFEKDEEQRKKILSIKSFASPKYGNDLTTKAILELAKKPFFDELSFDIYGMGELYEKDNEPLLVYKNVYLHNQFLTQDEIVNCHRTHGIYIATTRSDTQGVSRDEAMSSGLVPIANAVTAIPEFVDENSGYLVPGEDYVGIADAIEEMYYNPEIFKNKSSMAAQKVRNLSDKPKTIAKEVALIFENSVGVKR